MTTNGLPGLNLRVDTAATTAALSRSMTQANSAMAASMQRLSQQIAGINVGLSAAAATAARMPSIQGMKTVEVRWLETWPSGEQRVSSMILRVPASTDDQMLKHFIRQRQQQGVEGVPSTEQVVDAQERWEAMLGEAQQEDQRRDLAYVRRLLGMEGDEG